MIRASMLALTLAALLLPVPMPMLLVMTAAGTASLAPSLKITDRANDVVRINATYGISTMIIFGDDEKFETIALGDTESWQVVPTDKGNILFIKPVAKDASTNLNVVTSKRIYYFEMFDHDRAEEKKVFGIRFVFPENNVDDALRKEAEMCVSYPNISNIDRANMNIDYSFSETQRCALSRCLMTAKRRSLSSVKRCRQSSGSTATIPQKRPRTF